MRDIQRLMGCLLFSERDPGDTPYADLLSPTRWDEVAQEFARQACSLMGQVRGIVNISCFMCRPVVYDNSELAGMVWFRSLCGRPAASWAR
jgi:hypothetical protein